MLLVQPELLELLVQSVILEPLEILVQPVRLVIPDLPVLLV
ncbi:hypothetical protein NC3_18070 [Bacillus altitudinis]|nr:hypothetical protein NC3_18070 [Bacillus altitudinis]